jgi:hypothetical protein
MARAPSYNSEQSSQEQPASDLCRALNLAEGDDINEFEKFIT